MAEKRLQYNRDVVGQERIYTCGPASVQNLLSNIGIHVDEMQLATECGTHQGGTDHAGLIEPVLNRYAPQAQWQVVWMPNDPCTPQEKEDLWRHLVASVDAGYGLLTNFVAPASNYPRGTRGSQSPNYGGGTVFHYTSVQGYFQDDATGERHALVVDSGFQPPEYWISFDQLATLIPPKAYIWASAAPLPAAPPPDEAELLGQAMGWSLPIERYRALLPAVKDALRQSGCNTPRRVAAWLSQIGHESCGLLYMREIADGSAYEGRSDLGNVNPGDGVRYAGRGPIQITGRSNYEQLSRWAFERGLCPTPTYFVDRPEELESDTFAFLGAIWYWSTARGTAINDAADREDIVETTRLINGGDHGLADRTERYWRALPLADAFLPTGDAPPVSALSAPPPARFWPMESYRIVTSPFGPRWGTIHTGCDFGVEGGSGGKPVYAIQSGTVIHAGTASGYGGGEPGAGWLVIDSDDSQGGGVWEYGHIIAAPGIGVGSKVTAGELIAAINPNEATNGGVAPHLHVSFMPRGYDPGSKQDPLPALEGALEPGVPVAPPAPEPVPDPVPLLVTESVFSAPGTPLTGLPWHHSVEVNDRDLLLNIRAEGLLTQALVFAIAEKVGVDARAVYDAVRESF